MRAPSPMYHGTVFQVTVRFRSIPASLEISKKFLAASSGLFLDTKPESLAFGPGASSRKRTSASTPPSHGSKYGIAAAGPMRVRSR